MYVCALSYATYQLCMRLAFERCFKPGQVRGPFALMACMQHHVLDVKAYILHPDEEGPGEGKEGPAQPAARPGPTHT